MQYTDAELNAAIEAIGDGTSWPKFTTNPVVNWIVDCLIEDEILDWDESLYQAEISQEGAR